MVNATVALKESVRTAEVTTGATTCTIKKVDSDNVIDLINLPPGV